MISYSAPRWLVGGHSQTIASARLAPRPRVQYYRQRWQTPDHDFIDLDFTEPESTHHQYQNLWVLFHGLEGCSRSHYSVSMMHYVKQIGALGVVVHFRGCSGDQNLTPRAYHSGDSAELNWLLPLLRQKLAFIQNCQVIGISLGGNVLLKWLGELGSQAQQWVDCAVSISAPINLAAGAQHMASGFSRVYTQHFLRTLIPKALDKIRRFPGLGEPEKIKVCNNFIEFDNLVTAPWHGFSDAYDYYQKSSALQYLPGIAVPTLLVHAHNDPFLPGSYLPNSAQLPAVVQCLYPQTGGHVGFVQARGFRLNLEWMPTVCGHFFLAQRACYV